MIRYSISSLKIIITSMLLLTALAGHAQPVLFQEALSPRIANYDMEVKLDAQTGELQGSETLTWHNKTGQEISELQFHLYLNAFRNNKSSFMKEVGGKTPSRKFQKKGWGYIEVDKMALDSGEDLTRSMEFIHPDDDNADDKTVARLPLPRPIPAGGSIVLHIDFRSKLPTPPVARNGSVKDYFFFGQWFPKIGVFMDGKWNCHQYHSHTEFFSDFGVYNVHITVPDKNIVGATGVLVERKDNGDGRATHFYHAEDVHDFAWTTSPHFQEFTGRAQNVDIRVLMSREHAYQGERHVAAAKLAVDYFHNWYGEYPFPNLTVIDPPKGAFETAGMEYPTLITAGTVRGLPEGVRAVEMVIIHEFGHNYWYHLVASNEFEDSWLDEGINTYSEIRILRDIYGVKTSFVDWLGLKMDDMQLRRFNYVKAPDLDPIKRNGWQYYNGPSYTSNSYSRPALMLLTLENYLGEETMNKIMRTWFERWKFKHPTTKDFVDVANEVSGQDLSWFFNPCLYENAVLDYSVDFISTKKVPAGKGYDYSLSTSDAAAQEKTGKDKGREMYESVVKVRRLGEMSFPVEIEVKFKDGEVVREKWDGQDSWKGFRYVKPVKLESAVVAPDKKIPLDVNMANNKRTMQQQRKPKLPQNEYVEMLKFGLKPKN